MKTIAELYEEWGLSCKTPDSPKEIKRREWIIEQAMEHFPDHHYHETSYGTIKDMTWARKRTDLDYGNEYTLAPGVCSPVWWAKALEAGK